MGCKGRLLLCTLLIPASAWAAIGKFSSARINLTRSDVGISKDGRAAMMLGLASKQTDPLWVRVRIGTSSAKVGCDTLRRLDPKREIFVPCEQDSLQADTDYNVAITVYADSALVSPVEEVTTSLRFDRKELKDVDVMREATRLPKTYEKVSYSSKLGLGAAMFGSVGSEGTLLVRSDGLEFQSKKSTVAVAASQMRSVRLVDLTGKGDDPWVVVDYIDGQPRIFAVKPHSFRGSVDVNVLRLSIEHLFDTTRSTR